MILAHNSVRTIVMDVDNIKNLREWSPLSDLLSKIPIRIQKTFFYQDVNITCIDVLPDFIALGSDVGIVFWYNRSTGDVQKLRSEVSISQSIEISREYLTIDCLICSSPHP